MWKHLGTSPFFKECVQENSVQLDFSSEEIKAYLYVIRDRHIFSC